MISTMKAELSSLYVSFSVACFGVIASQVEFHDLIIITKSSFHLISMVCPNFLVMLYILKSMVILDTDA